MAATLAAARTQQGEYTALQRVCRLRNIAIVEALASSGMRVAELRGLRRGDLLPAQRGAIVTGKGEKSRAALFSQAATVPGVHKRRLTRQLPVIADSLEHLRLAEAEVQEQRSYADGSFISPRH
ncbi:MAG TPA: hypothetical protein VIU62_02195 [Chloroflexota bacterium]